MHVSKVLILASIVAALPVEDRQDDLDVFLDRAVLAIYDDPKIAQFLQKPVDPNATPAQKTADKNFAVQNAKTLHNQFDGSHLNIYRSERAAKVDQNQLNRFRQIDIRQHRVFNQLRNRAIELGYPAASLPPQALQTYYTSLGVNARPPPPGAGTGTGTGTAPSTGGGAGGGGKQPFKPRK